MNNPSPSAPVYALPGAASLVFQRSHIVGLPFNEVLKRLRAEIETAQFWNLYEIDPQALLSKDGYRIGPARQILFFHPRYVVRILAADPTALLEAPLKVAMLELPDGKTLVRWKDAAAAFARYGNPALTVLGKELADSCQNIAAAALEASPGSEQA